MIRMIVLLLLFLTSALVSGSEVAFFALSNTDLKDAQQSSNKRDVMVARLRQTPKRLLATILVANNLINIAIVLLFASLGDFLFGQIKYVWIKFLIEVGVITASILIFGDIIPKVYANRSPKNFARLMSYPLFILDKYVLFFLSIPMSLFTQFLQNKLGQKNASLSVNQLSQALEMTDENETTDEEQKILQGIVSFGGLDTKQVMRPRIDVFALEESVSFKEILELVLEKGYSRIPIYKEHIDSISGILYVKDLLPHIHKSSFDWMSLIRQPYFVPENKKLDDLLKDFQHKKNHLAVVVDEYGGTSGIISLEDIIEQIVGDISDEFDVDDLMYSKIDENNYVMDGKTYLKDFYRIFKIEDAAPFEDKKGESETLAGFVLEHTGFFPRIGTKFKFHHILFTIEAVDRKRIQKIKVSR